MQADLKQFIDSNPDVRELKRALTVQMVQQNYRYEDIDRPKSYKQGMTQGAPDAPSRWLVEAQLGASLHL